MDQKSGRVTVRNPVVKAATILRKGGAHGKSRKALRRTDKVNWQREIKRDGGSPFPFARIA